MTGRAIAKRKKAGRGKGKHAEYDPWVHTTDFAAISTCSQITNWKDSRRSHILSFSERKNFLCYDFADVITDIREQYPLELEETIEIAQYLKVPHPRLDGELMVMTVDFYIELNGITYIARDFKLSKHLCKKRVLVKLEIVRRYFALRNIDYGIVTELDIPEVCWWNVNWLHPRRDIDSLYPLTPAQVQRIGTSLSDVIAASREVVLADVCDHCDSELRLFEGASLAVARFMLANKAWTVDMRSKLLEPTQPMLIEVGDLDKLWSRACRTNVSE
ncbi:TnsA endonuclease C-terminal domain-containing protein [Occallatibacter riparius]|uniref:TnsA endonuclease N-terminal domain-containing protein n=1 Tax=Occallatibacter riparius TaxID=1002689 RepID=A0A9J7BQJ9_9BACT|nr:TnsA endonuclease C-terminal domain-containing protein [Occallatibacter riparius]UWZ85148.1 TnsA endonuclease N-terminal domain-containing protein [Occallatibacter riparius]